MTKKQAGALHLTLYAKTTKSPSSLDSMKEQVLSPFTIVQGVQSNGHLITSKACNFCKDYVDERQFKQQPSSRIQYPKKAILLSKCEKRKQERKRLRNIHSTRLYGYNQLKGYLTANIPSRFRNGRNVDSVSPTTMSAPLTMVALVFIFVLNHTLWSIMRSVERNASSGPQCLTNEEIMDGAKMLQLPEGRGWIE